jgi:hypothetical protein
MNKICSKCKIEKNVSEFIECPKGKFGVRGECKICKKQYDIEYRNKYPTRYKEICLKSNYKRKDKLKIYRKINREKRNSYLREWGRKNPDKKREQKFRNRYKINLPYYNLLATKQSNKCAICGHVPSGAGIDKYLRVDHDHTTKKIRGLLCLKCNSGLGFFKDDIDLLNKAKLYLSAKNYELV